MRGALYRASLSLGREGGRKVVHLRYGKCNLYSIQNIFREVPGASSPFPGSKHLGLGPGVVVPSWHKTDVGWDLPTVLEPLNFFRTTPQTPRAFSRQPCKPVFFPDKGYMGVSYMFIFGNANFVHLFPGLR